MPAEKSSALSPEPVSVPVFVDATGRRARRIERIAALVVLACMGYGLSLLIAALTGVPIDGAIVPYPDLGSTTHANHPSNAPSQNPTGAISPAPSASAVATSSPSSAATSHPTATPTAATTHRTGRPTATATATPTHGKTTSAPGVTHRPTARPTVAATGHGRVIRP